MGKRLISRDVIVLLFIVLAMGSIAVLSISATLSAQELYAVISSRRAVAWVITTGAASFLALMLLKSRRQAIDARRVLESFLDSAGDGIFAIDRKFIITMWNYRAEEITGHQAQEVIGMSLRDVMAFYRERDRTEDMVFIEEAMLYNELRHMPEPMYVSRKNGSEVPVGDSAAPLRDRDGDVVGCIIIFRDATQERKQKSLRSEFAYASHQLRTPVTKALWSLESALDKDVPEKEDLQVAYAALKSIRKLSNEILEASEIDQKIVQSKGVAVQVSEVCAQALQSNEDCIKDHKVSVKTDVSADIHVHGDAHLLSRILDELICNASMYNREGGTVSLSANNEEDNVVIEVRDGGIGVPEEEQPLVFTKFFRGNNIDTSRSPGAGLGLYIAKGYVEAMGGKLWFKSNGSGSSFFFSLPIARDEAVAAKN